MKKIYSLKEVLSLLQISKKTYIRRKEEVLNFLEFYWDYEYIEPDFLIHEEKNPIEPFPKYHKKITTLEFEKILIPIIAEQPIQTAKNLTRIVYKNPPKNLKISESTFERHTRELLKIWFGDEQKERKLAKQEKRDVRKVSGEKGYIGARVWVTLSISETESKYERMTPEQIEDFYDMFNLNDKNVKEQLADELNDYTLKDLRRQDLNEMISQLIITKYLAARKEYKEKYGGWPFKVSEKWLLSKEREKWGWE